MQYPKSWKKRWLLQRQFERSYGDLLSQQPLPRVEALSSSRSSHMTGWGFQNLRAGAKSEGLMLFKLAGGQSHQNLPFQSFACRPGRSLAPASSLSQHSTSHFLGLNSYRFLSWARWAPAGYSRSFEAFCVCEFPAYALLSSRTALGIVE